MEQVFSKVFISFKNLNDYGLKTQASKHAEELFQILFKKKKIPTFMSNETIIKEGNSNYIECIHNALSTAEIFIVIASEESHFSAPWIKYEYTIFLNEILSGRKNNAKIFVLKEDNVSLASIPIGLRATEIVNFSDIESLVLAVKKACKAPKRKISGFMQFLYPVVFLYNENKSEDRWEVVFPDLDIRTDGNTYEDAYMFGKDLLRVYFCHCLKYDFQYNLPSSVDEVSTEYQLMDKFKHVTLIDAIVGPKDLDTI